MKFEFNFKCSADLLSKLTVSLSELRAALEAAPGYSSVIRTICNDSGLMNSGNIFSAFTRSISSPAQQTLQSLKQDLSCQSRCGSSHKKN